MCHVLYSASHSMSPRKLANFRLDEDLIDGLKFVFERDGVPQSEQVRRAVRAWLVERGAIEAPRATKTARKRAGTRKRA